MALTIAAIQTAKPQKTDGKLKDSKLFDQAGLFLLVKKNGAKWWRFKYRFNGKEKLLSLGTYPEVSLADARLERNRYRELVARGINPSDLRKQKKEVHRNVTTLRQAADAWIKYNHTDEKGKSEGRGWSTSYEDQVAKRLERHILKPLGSLPVKEIDALQLNKVIAHLGSDIRHRLKCDLFNLFAFAKAQTWVGSNPASDDLKALMPKRQKRRHFAAITKDTLMLASLLRSFDAYQGAFQTRKLLQLAPLIFSRPSEIRLAKWKEFNLNSKIWTPALEPGREKPEEAIPVPLSQQAVAILRELVPLSGTSPENFVFPGCKNKKGPLSDNTVRTAIITLGFGGVQTSHGFRATARTMLREQLGFSNELIELQINHRVVDATGRAYNRIEFWLERCEMMQAWADYLDTLKELPDATERPSD